MSGFSFMRMVLDDPALGRLLEIAWHIEPLRET
jgi:hypothetical protein